MSVMSVKLNIMHIWKDYESFLNTAPTAVPSAIVANTHYYRPIVAQAREDYFKNNCNTASLFQNRFYLYRYYNAHSRTVYLPTATSENHM